MGEKVGIEKDPSAYVPSLQVEALTRKRWVEYTPYCGHLMYQYSARGLFNFLPALKKSSSTASEQTAYMQRAMCTGQTKNTASIPIYRFMCWTRISTARL